MAVAAARAAVGKQTIKPHIPLIKFPQRGSPPSLKKHVNTAVGKQDAVDQFFNSAITAQNAVAKESSIDACQIPQKYRRKNLTKEEMEFIEKGGPV